MLLEQELTVNEHRHMLEHGLLLDTWFHGFSKLALHTFLATYYFTDEDILELCVLMWGVSIIVLA